MHMLFWDLFFFFLKQRPGRPGGGWAIAEWESRELSLDGGTVVALLLMLDTD